MPNLDEAIPHLWQYGAVDAVNCCGARDDHAEGSIEVQSPLSNLFAHLCIGCFSSVKLPSTLFLLFTGRQPVTLATTTRPSSPVDENLSIED